MGKQTIDLIRQKEARSILLLHTSDLHLSMKNPRTIEALQEILEVGKKNKVDMLTISGDLFESEVDAEALRPKLRTKMFSGNGFEITVIPGNHDREAYQENLDFGSDLRILTKEPFDIRRREKVMIVGVPFLDKPSEELIAMLREARKNDIISILLVHCTLDFCYGSADFGDEEQKEYFPIDSQTLYGLGFDYVLAGHFHADFVQRDLGSGQIFIYPGSPISLSWKHLGKRRAALIDTDKRDVREIPLNTFYYDILEITIKPGNEIAKLDEVKNWVADHSEEACELRVLASGYGEMGETEFSDLLKKSAKPAQIEENRYKNVEDILRHPIFNDFSKLLDSNEEKSPEEKEKIKFRVIEAMSTLKAARKIL